MNRIPGLMILLLALSLGFGGVAIVRSAGEIPEGSAAVGNKFLVPDPPPTMLTIPKGTKLHIRLKDRLNAADSERKFRGTLDRPIKDNGRVILPEGTVIEGKFSFDSDSRDKRPAMAMRLSRIHLNGKKIDIETEVLALGVPVRDDGARLKALDSDDSVEKPTVYQPGVMFTFKLAEPVQFRDARR